MVKPHMTGIRDTGRLSRPQRKKETFLLAPQIEAHLGTLFSSSGPPEIGDDKSDCSELHSLLLRATATGLSERTSSLKNMGIGLSLCSGI